MELFANIKSSKLKREAENFVRQLSDTFALGGTDLYTDENALTLAQELAKSTVDKTQIRGLVEIAKGTGSIADILDTIKVRVGRDYRGNGWNKEGIGKRLLNTLQSLRAKVDNFIKQHQQFENEDSDVARLIHLQLCRNFLEVLAAHFEYIKRIEEDKNE